MLSLCLKLLLLPLLHLWLLCASVHHLWINCYHGSHFDGATSNIEWAWCGSAITVNTEGHKRFYWLSNCATPAASVPGTSQAYANYATGPPQINFFFIVKLSTDLLICVDVYCGVCFLLSGTILDALFTNVGLHIEVCTTVTIQSRPMAGICASCWWSLAHARNALSGCSLCYFE